MSKPWYEMGEESAETFEQQGTHTPKEFEPKTLKQAEIDHIVSTLEHTNYQITKSSKILGIARVTLHNKMQKLGIETKRK